MRNAILVGLIGLCGVALGAGPREARGLLPLAVTEGWERDLGACVAGGRKEVTVTVRHDGAEPLRLEAPEEKGPFRVVRSTCGDLKPGAACEYRLLWSPVTPGLSAGSLTLSAAGEGGPRTLRVFFKGVSLRPAALAVEGDSVFAPTLVGKTRDQTLTLKNVGEAPAESLRLELASPAFTVEGCTGALAPAASCSLRVRFQPREAGGWQAPLRITYGPGAAGGVFERTLAGTAYGPARLHLGALAGGDLGRRVTGTRTEVELLLANSGESPAEALEAAIPPGPVTFLGGRYPGQGGDCGTTLAPRTQCRLRLQLAPLIPGPVEQPLAVKYRDGLGPASVSLPARFEGITPAHVRVVEKAPGEFNARIITSKVDSYFTLTNEGQHEASELRLSAEGFQGRFEFLEGRGEKDGKRPCGPTLPAGASCYVRIGFQSAQAGTFDATLLVGYQSGIGEQNVRFPLRAQALAPARLTLDQTALDFGEVVAEMTETRLVTLKNEGEVPTGNFETKPLGEGFLFNTDRQGAESEICGQGVHEGRRCVFQVAFRPSQSGERKSQIRVEYHDGLEKRAIEIPLRGKGLAPARLELSEATAGDFGETLVSDEIKRVLTYVNQGEVAAVGIVPELEKGAEPFRLSKTDCGQPLAPGKSCTAEMILAPTEKGRARARFKLTFADGRAQSRGRTETLLSTVARRPAMLEVDGGEGRDLGRKLLGQQTERLLEVRNRGDEGATKLAGAFGEGTQDFQWKGGKFPGEGGTCGEVLPPGERCLLSVVFRPTRSGVQESVLKVAFFDGVKERQALQPLRGRGAQPGRLEWLNAKAEFPSTVVGTQAVVLLELRNPGEDEVRVAVEKDAKWGPFQFAGGRFPGKGGDCGDRIPANSTCRVALSYRPEGENGANETLTLNYGDGVESGLSAAVKLSGSARGPAVLEWSREGTLAFGAVRTGESAQEVIRVTNRGGTEAKLAVDWKPGGPFALTSTCGEGLAPGKSCELQVVFQAERGRTYSDRFRLDTFDGRDRREVSFSVEGEGRLPAELVFARGTLALGKVVQGEEVARSITLRNRGGEPATELAYSLSGDFSFLGGSYPGTGGTCGKSLAPGAECEVALVFRPREAGEHEGAVELRYRDGKETRSVAMALEGRGLEPPRALASEEKTP